MDVPALTDSTCGTVILGGVRPVRRMGFGAMRLTGRGVWGPPADPDNARAVLHRALDLGVNLIDTAEAYGPGDNEECIADALHPYPRGLVVATKGGLARQGPGQWSPDGHPDRLKSSCEASLQRLQVDIIDLYQLHSPDPDVPFAESVGALAELRDEGKIRLAGLSNVDVEQLRTAQSIVPVASVQNRYNITDRDSEDVLRACEADGIAFLPWYPLAAGDLGDVRRALDEIGADHGVSAHAVALAWLLQRSPVMAPIPGTSSIDHLESNVAAATLRLEVPQLERLDAFSPELSSALDALSAPRSARTQANIEARAGFFKRLWNRITG